MRRCAGRRLMLPVSSFVAEATQRPPEVAQLACVGIVETAAEKLVSLTRRTAMEMAGAEPRPGPDARAAHLRSAHDAGSHRPGGGRRPGARASPKADARQFAHQYPAYAADIAGETRKALDALRTDPLHRRRYDDFVSAMVYGEKPEFGEAIATVAGLVEDIW